jgi:hypothetical protein
MTLHLLIALFWPFTWLFSPAEPYPEPLRTVWVDSSESLNRAIENATRGDHIILKDGNYRGMKLSGLRGTAGHPIVISAQHSRRAIVNGSHDSRNLSLSNCAYIYLYGIRFTAAPIWGVTIGPAFQNDDKYRGCRNLRLYDCEVDHAGQSLIQISGNSQAIEIVDCELHDSGQLKQGNRAYAEGIYVGSGSSLRDRSHDVLIQGNLIYKIGNQSHGGEAIDIKCPVYNIRILDNQISEVWVHSGGAITILLNSVNYPRGHRNPNITVVGNRIDGVRHQNNGYDGAGICVGSNGILIQDNSVKNTQGPAFLSFPNAANTRSRVQVYDNKFYGEFTIKSHGHSLRNVSPQIDALRNLFKKAEVADD